MVNNRLHIICGNCGQDLKEPNMATWEYVPAIHDEETGEIIENADVFIRCDNCTTIHFLHKYMEEISECEVEND